jgi:hypothetical protein
LQSGFAFFLGELCQGPPQGSRIKLARPDQWIAGWQEVGDEDGALREVCRRFLHTYRPARPADFCAWFASSALTVADTRALFEGLAPDVAEIDVDGRRSFVLADDGSFPAPSSRVRLLPEYDVYVMGYRERDQLVPRRCETSSRRTAAAATKDLRGWASCSWTASQRGCGSARSAASGSS